MARRTLSVMLAVALLSSSERVQAGLVFQSGTRLVRAFVNTDVEDKTTSDDPGMFSADAESTELTFTATANQFSLTPNTVGNTAWGEGSVDVNVAMNRSVVIDSLMGVFFTVDADGFYTFDASVMWGGASQTLEGSASVVFENLTTPGTLASVSRSPSVPGTGIIPVTMVPLTTGTNYKITAHALIQGGANQVAPADAAANWNFTIAAVPEVSSIAMMGLAAIAASVLAWRGRGA